MPSYTYSAIDVPAATSTYGYDINNYGQTVGWFIDGAGYHGFLNTGGTYTTLDAPGTSGYTLATSINDSAQVTGMFNDGSGQHGFVYSGGTYTTLDNPVAIGSTIAFGINNSGQVVGNYGGAHGFLYSGGVYTTIDDPSATGPSLAYGINDSGDIVGTFYDGTGVHGFLYSGGVYSTIDDPLAAGYTQVTGINNSGQIVGTYVDGGGGIHGFFYSSGTYTTIDDPTSPTYTSANGLNDAGEIVGWSAGNGVHGFLATPFNANTAPTITSNGGGAIATVAVAENATAVTTAIATDPDIGQTLAFSLAGGDDVLKFAINTTSGVLTFVAAPDFETPTDVGADNNYNVVVVASDGAGGIDTQALTITVTNQIGETWSGGNGGQTHSGTGEEDTLTGGNGKDTLNGGGGNDIIFGGNGKDILTGGAGNDRLTGGNGADTFVFATGFGRDVVTDFGNDEIQFDHSVFANFAAVQSHAVQVGSDTVITYDANNTVTLQGVTVGSLHASDFSFV